MTARKLELPHGQCVVHELSEDALDEALATLPARERALAATLSPVRRRELVSGRLALRSALGQVPLPPDFAFIADDRGAPVMPRGWVGSISHKGLRVAAIAAPAAAGTVGIDLESAGPARQAIERRILTPRERAAITDPREVTLRFSIKEAIYKAIDPIVRRYVGFTEVELDVAEAGACTVTVLDPARLPVSIEAWWSELDGYWLATARAHRR